MGDERDPAGPRDGSKFSVENQEVAAKDGKLFSEINALRHQSKTPLESGDLDNLKFNEKTCMGRLAANKYFEYATLGVIVINALYLGYDCDYSTRWGKPEDLYSSPLWGFMFMDNFFCAFFTMEVVVRFLGYKVKSHSCTDISYLFDLALVTLMVGETWILAFIGPIDALKQVSILRLLRLTRLLRMGKLLRYLPELQLIVKGMIAAVRSVSCAGILLILVLYVFAIIFTNEYHQGLKEDDDPDLTVAEVFFGSMGKSMRHLLIMGTILDDLTACTNAIRASESIPMLLVFMVCIIISSFTIFNMLIGILCEVMEATSDSEKRSNQEIEITQVMLGFFSTMDIDGNGLISRQEFVNMRDHPQVMASIAKLGIDHKSFNKYAELLFLPKIPGEPAQALQYNEAVAMIMKLRPGSKINRCDFAHFRRNVTQDNRLMHRYLDDILETLDTCDAAKEEGSRYKEELAETRGRAHPSLRERTLSEEQFEDIRRIERKISARNNSRPSSPMGRPASASRQVQSPSVCDTVSEHGGEDEKLRNMRLTLSSLAGFSPSVAADLPRVSLHATSEGVNPEHVQHFMEAHEMLKYMQPSSFSDGQPAAPAGAPAMLQCSNVSGTNSDGAFAPQMDVLRNTAQDNPEQPPAPRGQPPRMGLAPESSYEDIPQPPAPSGQPASLSSDPQPLVPDGQPESIISEPDPPAPAGQPVTLD